MEVRRGHPSEASELTALVFASKQSNGYDDAFMASCAEELRISEEDLRKGDIWVAVVAGKPAACARLQSTDTSRLAEVSSFFVHPDFKRQGVGRHLWTHLLETARADQITRLHLDADPEAVPFYEAMGFYVVGQTPSGSIPGRFLPLMERTV